jgi:hypothetical protein
LAVSAHYPYYLSRPGCHAAGGWTLAEERLSFPIVIVLFVTYFLASF